MGAMGSLKISSCLDVFATEIYGLGQPEFSPIAANLNPRNASRQKSATFVSVFEYWNLSALGASRD